MRISRIAAWFGMVLPCFAILLLATTTAANDHQSPDGLRRVESKVVGVVQKVLPCTVGLGSEEMPVSGSGVIVSQDGLILTAGHVTQAAGKDLIVFFPDGKRAKAKALGANYSRDTGMAKILDEGEYPFVELGNSNSLQRDQWCVALGHAGGYQQYRTPPVRLGRVIRSDPAGFIDSDCTLIGGDSGGPLFDIEGRLIGIHSNIGTTLTMNRHVPIDAFRDDWKRLEEGESWGRLPGMRQDPGPDTAILGVRPLSTSADVTVEVIPESPAAKAGVQDGDKIQSLNGKPLESFDSLAQQIMSMKAGELVKLSVERGERTIEIDVELGRWADIPPAPRRPRIRRRDPERRIEQQEPEVSKEPTNEDGEPDRDQADDEDEPAEEQITEEQIEKELKGLLEDAIQRGGTLELTPEQIERFGGPRRIARRLGKLFRSGDLADLHIPLPEIMPEEEEDTFFEEIMTTFESIVNRASQSVLPIVRGDQSVVLATAVRDDGYFLTKASEVGGDAHILSGDKRLPLKVVKRFPTHDLALVKADVNAQPVDWYLPEPDPPVGSIVAAAGPNGQPLAVGVISVLERNLSGSDRAFLGVVLEQSDDGIEVFGVQQGSAADQIGIEPGDVIKSIEGKQYDTVADLVSAISAHKPGEQVRIRIKRGEQELDRIAKLGSRAQLRQRSPNMQHYPTGGRLSRNRDGYSNALQTDLPISPEHCGSPLVDLDGRILGINIARAGRIKSYAVPGDVIQQLLATVDFAAPTGQE